MITAFKLGGFFAAHAIWSVSDGETLIPIFAYTTGNHERSMERLIINDDLEGSVEFGKEKLQLNSMDAIDAVLLYDGRISIGKEKVDAIIIEVRAYFSPSSEATIAVPYTPDTSGRFRVHRPKLLAWENCEDFDMNTALQSFFEGVNEHEKGSRIWNECLDESQVETLSPSWLAIGKGASSMIEYFKSILLGQFEAALCMLHDCIRRCPEAHWEGRIANDSFRQIAYHTLFYVDYYLSPSEAAFALRDLHLQGGDERLPTVSIGLTKNETLSYATISRQKAQDILSEETPESLQRESGFSNLHFSRGEAHLSSIRHIQHHTGQLSAFLRRVAEDDGERWWVKTGWR